MITSRPPEVTNEIYKALNVIYANLDPNVKALGGKIAHGLCN